MNTILSSRKRHHLERVRTVLIAIALLALMVGCLAASCNDLYLTMKVSPSGSGWTNPSDTANPHGPYSANDPISITATANTGYQFAGWTVVPPRTAPPPTDFDDAYAQSTIYRMAIINATVTAHFVGPLDHFKCYTVLNSSYIGKGVNLKDQFVTIFNATVTWAQYFGNPAMKWHNNVTTNISNPNDHLTVYNITPWEPPQTWQVEVVNQFGVQNLTVSGPVALAVPTWKLSPGNHTPPVNLDHYLLYEVIAGPVTNVTVAVGDEFGYNLTGVWVYKPLFFANPVQKTYDGIVTNITDPEAHLVFYEIAGETFSTVVQVSNQFGNQPLVVENPALLAVLSAKLSWQLLQ
jgi:hypothetical protein